MDQPVTNKIHIALGFDNNYIVHVYALLTSIIYNNKDNDLHFHVIATGITDLEKSNLINYIHKSNAVIEFYEVNEDVVRAKTVIPADTHFTIATYYRLFFPSLIDKSIKKLLYIDSDVIVNGNLKGLYNIDLKDLPIAAAPDSFPVNREDLGITEQGNYFNAGVLLIDTKNWRDQNVTENALEFLRDYPEKVILVDQDALNATLKNRWYKLDVKYNFTLSDVKLQVPVAELVKDVVIVHYTSYRKPWLFLSRNKLRYLYHYYLKMSPKANEKKYTDLKWDLTSMWTFMRIRFKEFYFDRRLDKFIPIRKWMDPTDLSY